MWNGIEFEVFGDYALFTNPLTRMGGEKSSYPVPTYSALRGIVESLYWKPSLKMIVDSVRIMNPIRMESKGIRPINYGGGNTLANYTYLRNVRYRVKAYFVFNKYRPDLSYDHNENKHYSILKRSLKAGGRRDIFLGTRECQGYVVPKKFDEEEGYYDGVDMALGTMLHSFGYPDETGKDELTVKLWNPVMEDGIIKFITPEECTMIRSIRKFTPKEFNETNIQKVDDLYREMKGGS